MLNQLHTMISYEPAEYSRIVYNACAELEMLDAIDWLQGKEDIEVRIPKVLDYEDQFFNPQE